MMVLVPSLICKGCTKPLSFRLIGRVLSFRTFATWQRKSPAHQVQKCQSQCFSSKNLKKNSLPFELNTATILKDVLIYSHKNERFYKLLTYFGCAQFIFWAYLGVFSFQTLKDAPEESEQLDPNASWWRRMATMESKYKNGISILCFCFGYLVLCISIMYPARAVRSMWLLKGGNNVQLDTYSAVTQLRTLIIPVNSVSCMQSRMDSAAQIPMKVKGKWFFFLLDKRGKFHNTELFDFAIGLSRHIK